ncbi:MAG: hypothetical protein FWF29_07890 [Treponema sp.]|nr:hypothetical protein [Treponema sp.]
MLLAVFEAIMNDSAAMQAFTSDPIRHAAFLAFYDYVKAGHKLTDLPWLSNMPNLRKLENEFPVCIEKAA